MRLSEASVNLTLPRKPRVLYLIPVLELGGAELGFVTILDQAFFQGMDVSLACLRRGRGGLDPLLRERNVPVTVLAGARGGLTGLGVAALRLRSLIAEFDPDILIMSLPLANLVGRIVSPRRSRLYRVSFEHSVRYGRAVYRLGLRLLSSRIDAVMADCEETLAASDQSLGSGRARERWTVPLAAFAQTLPVKTSHELRVPARILSVGRLVRDKNYTTTLEALARLRRRGPDFRYTIIGAGPEGPFLRREVSRLGLDGRVEFAGERCGWTREAADYDVMLITSRREGVCISAVEAMACGLPVLAPQVGGIRGYGKHRVNMIKLADLSPEAIAGALEEILQDRELRSQLGRRGAEDARTAFGEASVQVRLAHIRSQLLAASERKQRL